MQYHQPRAEGLVTTLGHNSLEGLKRVAWLLVGVLNPLYLMIGAANPLNCGCALLLIACI
jgi:hypothetical protein